MHYGTLLACRRIWLEGVESLYARGHRCTWQWWRCEPRTTRPDWPAGQSSGPLAAPDWPPESDRLWT